MGIGYDIAMEDQHDQLVSVDDQDDVEGESPPLSNDLSTAVCVLNALDWGRRYRILHRKWLSDRFSSS